MDHKEFLDEVMNNMTTDVTENENMDDSIQLKMSTGEVYLVDPSTFDWNNAIINLPQMAENENTLCSIMFSLLNVTDPTNEDSVEFVKHTIEQLEDFMNNLQIHPDYEAFDANISDYKKAVFMVFDAMNVVKIMNHHTSVYQILNMFAPSETDSCSCGCEDECECDHNEHKEMKTFKVTATLDVDNKISDMRCDEIDPIRPDEYDIPDYERDAFTGGTVATVIVCDPDEDSALCDAREIITADIMEG